MTTIVERLAAYAAASDVEQLPDAVLHHGKRALLDWFAAVLPGTGLAPASHLRKALADEIGNGGAIWPEQKSRRQAAPPSPSES